MTGAGGTAATVATQSPGDGETTKVRTRPRRRWVAAAGGLLLAVALAAALTLGATYQPVRYGDVVVAVQGAVHVRIVNDFGFMRGQLYVLPQPAKPGDLVVSLRNTGPFAVRIESVGVPQDQDPNGLQLRNG
ncbi:MAG TPA: hypothetical protein VFI65_18310, partial [Streptosporangiaceae bacterium]|nr:hypothetical protein [Streptosporangiaceae bacterium]